MVPSLVLQVTSLILVTEGSFRIDRITHAAGSSGVGNSAHHET